MQTVTSFSASALSRDQLTAILSDQLAFENMQVFRRLLVVRCGGLAGLAALVGALYHQAPWVARTLPALLFLVPPVWAWVVEHRLRRRISQRLARVDSAWSSEKVIRKS